VCRDLTLLHVSKLTLDELLADGRDLIDEENPLNVVILMLDHASGKARVSLTMGLEVSIQILDGDRRRARDLLIDTRDTEATLILGEGLFTTLDDASIDEGLLEPNASAIGSASMTKRRMARPI